jgi:hypothetical protein
MILPVLVLALITVATTAQAQQNAPQRLAIQNAIEELVQCSSFFLISAQCIRNNPSAPADLARRLDSSSEQLNAAAIELAKGIGMKPEALGAKLRMTGRQHFGAISSDCANISILMERHLDRCGLLTRDPAAVLR